MLDWQYFQLLNQLGQVELHAGDATCPCSVAGIGEYCVPKHLGLVSSLALETASMDSKNAETLNELAESAQQMHQVTKKIYEGVDTKTNIDLVTWARNWRKDHIENMYYRVVSINKPKQKVIKLSLSSLYDLEVSEISPEEKSIPGYTKKLKDCVLNVEDSQKHLQEKCSSMFNADGTPKDESIGKTCDGQIIYSPYAVCRASLLEYYNLVGG